jgi:hypothetical protein
VPIASQTKLKKNTNDKDLHLLRFKASLFASYPHNLFIYDGTTILLSHFVRVANFPVWKIYSFFLSSPSHLYSFMA